MANLKAGANKDSTLWSASAVDRWRNNGNSIMCYELGLNCKLTRSITSRVQNPSAWR